MSERWKPKQGEAYYFFDSALSVESECYEGDYVWDEKRIAIGNCFKTEVEAKAAIGKVKALLLSLNEPTKDCNQLPKLTAEVFNRTDCPEDAKIAVVNQDGSVCFGSFATAESVVGFWRGEGDGKWFPLLDKWDASDWENSLIKRPVKETKLPDWCKVGEWVWAIAFNTYFKVDKVDGIFISGTDFSGSGYSVAIENVRQAHPRPYNAEEMQGLIGKVVSNEHGNMFLVTAFVAVDGGEVCVDGSVYNADDLFECYTINGKPCGVLEHLDEKGEWVK